MSDPPSSTTLVPPPPESRGRIAGPLLAAVDLIALAASVVAFLFMLAALSARVDPEGLIAPFGFTILAAFVQLVLLVPLAFALRFATRARTAAPWRGAVLWVPLVGLALNAASLGFFTAHEARREARYRQESFFYASGLDEAIRAGDAARVSAILDEWPALLTWPGLEGTAIDVAAESGSAPVVELLLRRGAIPDESLPPHDDTPLHRAARRGHADVVKLLLDAGANPAAQNGSGRTPADEAARRGHDELAELLRGAR